MTNELERFFSADSTISGYRSVQCKRQADAVQALKFHGMSWSICEIGQP